MCFGLWKWKASAVMASLSAVNLMINYNYIYIFVPNIFRTWSLFKWVSCSLVSAAEMYSTWFGRSFQSAAFNQRLVVWIPREFRMQGTVTYLLGFQSNNPNPGQWLFEVWWFCDSFCFIQFFFNMFHSISYSPTVFSRQQKINLRDHFFSISDPTLKPMTDPWCYQVQHL